MQMQEASMTNNPTQVVDMPSLKLEVSLWAPSTKLYRKNEDLIDSSFFNTDSIKVIPLEYKGTSYSHDHLHISILPHYHKAGYHPLGISIQSWPFF